MGQRQSAAVYRRRRIVALMLVLVPLLLIMRSCGDETPAAPATVTGPSEAATSGTPETTTLKARVSSVQSETRTAKPRETVTAVATPVIRDCSNSDIQVTITADAEAYAIGTPITMAMRISNSGRIDCKRDVGALSNEVYVTDVDGAIVWSSDACQVDGKPQVALMHPGAVFGSTQRWSGRNSGRDCNITAPDATAGSYLAYARNDTVLSKPFAFTIG